MTGGELHCPSRPFPRFYPRMIEMTPLYMWGYALYVGGKSVGVGGAGEDYDDAWAEICTLIA